MGLESRDIARAKSDAFHTSSLRLSQPFRTSPAANDGPQGIRELHFRASTVKRASAAFATASDAMARERL